ncbi:hypothetical protein E4U24_000718 [Claviceps purpurea]|nr:hypothetical protein E4U24_000718 [Claviceps purpurea]
MDRSKQSPAQDFSSKMVCSTCSDQLISDADRNRRARIHFSNDFKKHFLGYWDAASRKLEKGAIWKRG